MGSCGIYIERGGILGSVFGRWAVARLMLASLFLLAFPMFVASSAKATPLIPFDAPELSGGYSYGYVDPGSYGITTFRDFTDYYQAVDSGSSAASDSLLLVDPVSFNECTQSGDDCDNDSKVFHVEWDITFNADVLDDPSGSYLLDLILVDSDPASKFDDLVVTIDYSSATLDGIALDFETASMDDGEYYFIDLVLGAMLDGETKRIGFSYHATGDFPLSEDDVGKLAPVILPGSYATQVPEPGTASLLGLGLAALALRRRRA